jgi:orotate phosphoribosyltransferase
MQDPLIALLAGRRGHFQMESGYHSELWFKLDALFERPEKLRPFVVELARRLAAHRIAAVCGPMTGGAKLARMIADELGAEYLFTERFDPPGATGFFPVKYFLPAARRATVRGKSVAIVDDAVSAGSAARGTYADLVACGARPVALGALFVFGGGAAQFAAEKNLALESIAQMSFGIWPPSECPLCRAGVAVEKVSDAAQPPATP